MNSDEVAKAFVFHPNRVQPLLVTVGAVITQEVAFLILYEHDLTISEDKAIHELIIAIENRNREN